MTDIRTMDSLRDEALRAVQTLSDMQFRLGYLAVVAHDHFGLRYNDFAAEINSGSTSLNEYACVVRFYRTDNLPDDLIHRIEDLHELRQTGVVTYTHFRAAKRIGAKDKGLSREAQVEIAVAWLEARLDDGDKVDVIEARAAAESGGESFEKMSISWDSRQHEKLPLEDIGWVIESTCRALRQDGKQYRVVVYEGNGDG